MSCKPLRVTNLHLYQQNGFIEGGAQAGKMTSFHLMKNVKFQRKPVQSPSHTWKVAPTSLASGSLMGVAGAAHLAEGFAFGVFPHCHLLS